MYLIVGILSALPLSYGQWFTSRMSQFNHILMLTTTLIEFSQAAVKMARHSINISPFRRDEIIATDAYSTGATFLVQTRDKWRSAAIYRCRRNEQPLISTWEPSTLCLASSSRTADWRIGGGFVGRCLCFKSAANTRRSMAVRVDFNFHRISKLFVHKYELRVLCGEVYELLFLVTADIGFVRVVKW